MNPKETRLVKRCRVCGDQAFAFNYNGLSCESCKSFFRRNAFSLESFKCKHANNCPITLTTRRFCGRCRLEKCFNVGMSRHLLLKPTASKRAPHAPPVVPEAPKAAHRDLPPSYETHCLGLLRSTLLLLGEKPLGHFTILGTAHDIRQLQCGNKQIVKRLVRYGQRLDGFRTLTGDEQATLLGTAFSEVLLLRSAFYFSFERDSLLVLLDSEENAAVYVKLELFYGDKGSSLIYLHRALAHLIRDLLEKDTLLLELMVVLLMFKNRSNLYRQEVIHYQYVKYCHLLRKYLLSKHPNAALAKYDQLLGIIGDTGPLAAFLEDIIKCLALMPHQVEFQKYINTIIET